MATPTPVTVMNVAPPIVIAFAFIALCSLLREPARQRFSAIFVAGAGAAYFAGGFGPWEQAFCVVIAVLAYRGLSDYRAIGVAWLLHSGWDLAHDLYGNPIIPYELNSSFGCFITDPIIAIWYLVGAPSPWRRPDAGKGSVQAPARFRADPASR